MKPLVALALVLPLSVLGACSEDGKSRTADPGTGSGSVRGEWSSNPAEWTVRPGGVGPIELGTMAPDLVDLGYAVPVADHTCSVYWRQSPKLDRAGISLDFVLGARNDLDQILVADQLRSDVGIEVGDTVATLEAAYPGGLLASQEDSEGGPLRVRTAFGEAGALSYEITAGRVSRMLVTAGTDEATFRFPALGC